MNQFQVFLRMEKKPLLAWALGTGVYVALMGLIYVAMGGGEGLAELAESYPQEILDAIGAEDLSTVKGFLGAEFGAIAPLVFGIFLIMLMTKHLAGAEEGGRLDHVLARPVPRALYYWSLLGAGATIYAVILAVAAVFGVLGFAAVAEPSDLPGIVGAMVDMLPFGLIFLGLGGLLGAAFHQRGRANAFGAGAVVLFFAMDFASRLVDSLEWLTYVTPMGYLGRSDLAGGDLDIGYVAFSLAAAGLTAVGGWQLFIRKQLYA